jgi:DNA-binding MarR family transcriptional regulator
VSPAAAAAKREYAEPIAQVHDDTPASAAAGDGPSAPLRRLLHRREAATARHRAALARALGLSDVEMTAVFHVAHHVELSQRELSDLLELSPGGTAALVQRLEQEGHVVRRRGDDDRRLRLIRLSPALAARSAAFYAPLVRELDELVATALEGRPELVELLAAVAEASERHADRACERAPVASEPPPRLTPALWG